MRIDYLILLLAIAYLVWRFGSAWMVRRRLPELMQEGAQLVDVRSAGEFAAGHVPGSVNIPLDEIGARASELDPQKWVVVFCASGTRSAMARHKLKGLGFPKVVNAGSWRSLR
jgi:rhodanese-related sulfurtransferase